MLGALLAVAGAYGVHLLYTGVALGWTGVRPGPGTAPATRPGLAGRWRDWMTQAGLAGVSTAEFVGVSAVLGALGLVAGLVLLGGWAPSVVLGLGSAALPAGAYRRQRTNRMAVVLEGWPQLIEEVRVLTGALGRSIPQALLDAGIGGPPELRGAFEAAQREWLLTTDFHRTIAVLKRSLADPTGDATCETLLVAHEVGGADLDRRLAALAEDRRQDAQGRKDARSRQAGVRFARRFVLIVPLGMAAVGAVIGNGREGFRTPQGQLLSVVAVGLVVCCWAWSGRMMRLPSEARVFAE